MPVVPTAKTVWQNLIDGLIPPSCPITRERVDATGLFSAAGWASISTISAPYCDCCGTPFSHDLDYLQTIDAPPPICPSCLTTPPPYTKARAATVYQGTLRQALLSFKHGDKTHLACHFAPLMVQAAADFLTTLPNDTYLVPVPLHWLRLIRRQYNQAALLSHEIARKTGLPHLPEALIRTRWSQWKGHKSKAERLKDTRHSFAVHPQSSPLLKGKTVLLIDDVITSGATIEACVKALKKSDVAAVYVLTLARVVVDKTP